MIVTPLSVSPAMIDRSTGAAPRQRGRSDGCTLSQGRSSSTVVGNDESVRDDDHRRSTEVEFRNETLRLQHGNPESLGDLLRRRCNEPPPTSCGSVGRVRRQLISCR